MPYSRALTEKQSTKNLNTLFSEQKQFQNVNSTYKNTLNFIQGVLSAWFFILRYLLNHHRIALTYAYTHGNQRIFFTSQLKF
jgi:hypothetical protein